MYRRALLQGLLATALAPALPRSITKSRWLAAPYRVVNLGDVITPEIFTPYARQLDSDAVRWITNRCAELMTQRADARCCADLRKAFGR